ncbi:MAG: thiamine pyrophosphate-dependent enzyme [Clostridia bacterium]
MKAVFTRPKALVDRPTHYCPGCIHGVAHRMIGQAMDEMELKEKAIGVAPVGCSVFAYDYFDCDFQEAAHGRAPAVATGIKRAVPDAFVFTYQGDGDLASIGTAEIIHAASRGENISVIFINNAIYGMTGGQMAPTTLEGQRTTTSPGGRDVKTTGQPLKMTEMLATLPGATYLARGSCHDIKGINATQRYIRRAFETQIQGKGFSMVEIISNCPTNWGMTPIESLEWIKENMLPFYPLGEFRAPEEVD